MTAYLITWKPASENPEKGWPFEELQALIKQVRRDGSAVEPWRFQSHKAASNGDRVFLLRQGRAGPAIIGYGRVAGAAFNKKGWQLPIRLERLVDPTKQILASSPELMAITSMRSVWGTQASGTSIPDEIERALERLVVGRTPLTEARPVGRNPPWTRDELILALDLYFRVNPVRTSEQHPEILALSELLSRLPIRPRGAATFRNPTGVYMKLCNFLRLDPDYKGKGLDAGSKLDVEIWNEFAGDIKGLAEVARAIRNNLPSLDTSSGEPIDPEFAAVEGMILSRVHLTRERNSKLVEQKKREVLKAKGKLTCEVCGFDFEVVYRDLGKGFAECHHRTPLSQLKPGTKTRLADLAIVCANCHRIIHRSRRWLLPEELRALIRFDT